MRSSGLVIKVSGHKSYVRLSICTFGTIKKYNARRNAKIELFLIFYEYSYLRFMDKLYGEVSGFLKYHAVSTGLPKTLKSIETSWLLTEVSVAFRTFETPVVRNGVTSQKT